VTAADVADTDRHPSGRPITVVHLITTLTQGGAERALDDSVPRPRSRGTQPDGERGERHVVVSLTEGGMFAERMAAADVDVRSLGMRSAKDVVRGSIRLTRLLRDVDPDVVISWMYHAMFLALVTRRFAGRGRRRTSHTWVIQSSLQSTIGSPWHTRAIIRQLARSSAFPDAIAINSRSGRERHADAGFRPRRWHHLPNGCDTERFSPEPAARERMRRQLGIDTDRPVIAFVGRNHPEKGLDVLMDALQHVPEQLPRLTVMLVGSGTDTVEAVGLEGLDLLALGERADVPELLRAADILVLPSRTEGTPNAVIEAMASGLPCVVADVGDSADVVGPTGLVVAPGSPQELADALGSMLRMAPETRAEWGAAARARVIERYSLSDARASYRALWSTVTR
jgi:glycosyltransferase involved in cell wall biosynthesis